MQAWRDYDGGSTRDGSLMFTVYNKIRRIILSGIVWLNLQEIVEASGFRCPNFCGYLRCHVRSGSTGSTEIPNDSVTESRAKNRSSSTVGGCAAPYGDAGGEVNELVFCPSEGSRVLTELWTVNLSHSYSRNLDHIMYSSHSYGNLIARRAGFLWNEFPDSSMSLTSCKRNCSDFLCRGIPRIGPHMGTNTCRLLDVS